LPAGEYGTAKLEYGCNEERLTNRQRARTDRGSHRVGHIVGADSPGHKQAEYGR
jgi:hypothetical protein